MAAIAEVGQQNGCSIDRDAVGRRGEVAVPPRRSTIRTAVPKQFFLVRVDMGRCGFQVRLATVEEQAPRGSERKPSPSRSRFRLMRCVAISAWRPWEWRPRRRSIRRSRYGLVLRRSPRARRTKRYGDARPLRPAGLGQVTAPGGWPNWWRDRALTTAGKQAVVRGRA